MGTRQKAVLSFVKFNKFVKQLTYNICILGKPNIFSYAEELLNFESWSNDVIEYVRFDSDTVLLNKIASMGSPKMLEQYLEEGKGIIPESNYNALSKVVHSMNAIMEVCYEHEEEAKGQYKYLVKEFANEEAAALFDRAVREGFLTAEYQPKGDTDLYTLKFLAYAIGNILHLTTRHKWSHFEELWNISKNNKLSSLPITEKQYKRAKKLMELYPEVDFTKLTKPQEDLYFEASYGSRKVRDLYYELIEHGYIDGNTTADDFLSIFNLGTSETRKPVAWMKSQRQLSYFIYNTFSKTNKDYWVKTQACFSINGKAPHKGSLISGLQTLQAQTGYGSYDVELKRIASNYNQG
jgi:hypothetical protein